MTPHCHLEGSNEVSARKDLFKAWRGLVLAPSLTTNSTPVNEILTPTRYSLGVQDDSSSPCHLEGLSDSEIPVKISLRLGAISFMPRHQQQPLHLL